MTSFGIAKMLSAEVGFRTVRRVFGALGGDGEWDLGGPAPVAVTDFPGGILVW
jgi:hypothetical protein